MQNLVFWPHAGAWGAGVIFSPCAQLLWCELYVRKIQKKKKKTLRSNGVTSCELRLMLERTTQKSYALIASNLATLYTQRDIINRKIFLEDSHG